MKTTLKITVALGLLSLLAACTTMPSGPAVMVLPGTGKNFEQFRYDEQDCRQYSQAQIGATPDSAAIDSGARSAALGTVLGAVAGAAIGGSHGAGVGAGTGLAIGGLVGTGTAQASGYTIQQRYDIAYQQCMYAKGHRVPVAASSFVASSSQNGHRPASAAQAVPQASNAAIPPPPPGSPPPPPKR